MAVVFGSLRLGEGASSRDAFEGQSEASPFDEHILVVGWSDGQGGHGASTLYLDGPEVQLGGGAATHGAGAAEGAAAAAGGPRMSWQSRLHGGLRASGDEARLRLRLRELELDANISAAAAGLTRPRAPPPQLAARPPKLAAGRS